MPPGHSLFAMLLQKYVKHAHISRYYDRSVT
jgi:hypothetical protein